MNLRKSILSSIFAATLAFSTGAALAQDATPGADADATPVTYLSVEPRAIKTTDGAFAGTVSLWEDADGVHLVVKGAAGEALAPGEHSVDIHDSGVCDADDAFSSAGDHLHAGEEATEDDHSELGALTVEEDGSFELWGTLEGFTLNSGEENSLNDADGTAIIIHTGGEDETREACGVIFEPLDGEATPIATPADQFASIIKNRGPVHTSELGRCCT